MSEFFAYAVRRGHISKHPASNVVSSDLPKVKVKPPKFFTIDETKEILSYMQKRHSHYTLWFAIGFFTGIRHAEINRLTMDNFIVDRKEILLKGDIVKTGDTWLMADLPDNLWEWVKKYEYRAITDSAWKKLTKQMRKDLPHINWHHNGLRHSFATYHLSKYRDASKTSLLLRHRNRETLWQHYLGGLVSEDIANQYFSIIP
jgi:integrase